MKLSKLKSCSFEQASQSHTYRLAREGKFQSQLRLAKVEMVGQKMM